MLRDVKVDWSGGALSAAVDTAAGRGEIVAVGLNVFRCTHHQPWGPSASINFVTSRSTGANISELRLEMQSGDLIEIEATSITFSAAIARPG